MADIENMLVNGYAYPTISPQVLDWWLPRIDWVSDFSYGFNAAGELINLEDQNIIAEASAAGVREMMVLAPLNEEGSFDGTIATAMFDDPVAVNRLIDNIEANIKEKGMATRSRVLNFYRQIMRMIMWNWFDGRGNGWCRRDI